MLIDEFKEFEVSRALKQMYPLKSLGPNGMPPSFFQHFWPTTASVVTKIVLDFLNLGIIPPKFNETHIVLIRLRIQKGSQIIVPLAYVM